MITKVRDQLYLGLVYCAIPRPQTLLLRLHVAEVLKMQKTALRNITRSGYEEY